MISRRATKAELAARVAELEAELEKRDAEHQRALAEALDQQTATSEILRVISHSPTNVQPVLDIVARNAARVCGATDAQILLVEGESLRLRAHYGPIRGFPVVEQFPIHRGTLMGRSILDGRTGHIHDLYADEADLPAERAIALRFGHRTALATPLMREGLPIGVLLIRRAEVQPFTDKQIELLKTFADQAVIAIEDVRLFTELQEKNHALTEAHARATEALEQQTATGEVLRAISGVQTDAQPVFDIIAGSAPRLFGAGYSQVALYDGELLHLGAFHNVSLEGVEALRRRFPMRADRRSAMGRAIQTRAIVEIPDVLEDPDYAFKSELETMGFRSILVVPMLRKGEPIGAIAVGLPDRGPFSDKQVALLKTFADQAVIAIENVRLFKELQARTRELTRSVEQLTALGEVGRAVSSTLDLDTVLTTIVSRAVQLSGTDGGSIYEYDEATEEFALRATHNLDNEYIRLRRETHLRKGEGVTGRLALSREPVQVPDITAPGAYDSRLRDGLLRSGARAVLAVPLLREDHLIGGLVVNRNTPGEFPPEVVDILKTFSTQSALAIQNARLFREIEDKSRELEALSRNMEQLYRLSTAMQEPLSLKEQLGRVLETATRIGLLDRIYVWAVSPEGDKLVNLAGAGFAEDEWKQFEGFALPLVEAGAMYRSLREGRPLLFDDENPLPRDLYLKPQYLLKGLRTNRFLIIPMIARGETVGVFAGDNKPSGRPIARETVELLQTFASHGAVAIANARLFQTIEEKSRELEAASRHKSEFLSNMSHELRTPLNAIIGFSEVLGDRLFGELTDKQEEYLKDIMESGQHLLSLINDILDLSKIEAGRMELEPAEFDLPQAIDNALTLVRERAGRRGIALHQAVDERLGEIRGDERKVKQVLLNLLSNALKFTPEGGRIDVSARLQDGSAEISVADTGVGIAPEDQKAVFEEFRQVGTAAKKVEGTGLGLALSRKFVELHGGRIWVNSQVGMGSTFTFTLPVRRGG